MVIMGVDFKSLKDKTLNSASSPSKTKPKRDFQRGEIQ